MESFKTFSISQYALYFRRLRISGAFTAHRTRNIQPGNEPSRKLRAAKRNLLIKGSVTASFIFGEIIRTPIRGPGLATRRALGRGATVVDIHDEGFSKAPSDNRVVKAAISATALCWLSRCMTAAWLCCSGREQKAEVEELTENIRKRPVGRDQANQGEP